MWKSAVKVGSIEFFLYAIVVVAPMTGPQGRGVAIAFLPLFWLVLVGRLWMVLRVADLARAVGSWQFVLIASLLGFVLSVVLFTILGVDGAHWASYRWAALPALAHTAAALLACRSAQAIASQSSRLREEGP
jgi:hypothetical protein